MAVNAKYFVTVTSRVYAWSKHVENGVQIYGSRFGEQTAGFDHFWDLDMIDRKTLNGGITYSGDGMTATVRGAYTNGRKFRAVGNAAYQFFLAWKEYNDVRIAEGESA